MVNAVHLLIVNRFLFGLAKEFADECVLGARAGFASHNSTRAPFASTKTIQLCSVFETQLSIPQLNFLVHRAHTHAITSTAKTKRIHPKCTNTTTVGAHSLDREWWCCCCCECYGRLTRITGEYAQPNEFIDGNNAKH